MAKTPEYIIKANNTYKAKMLALGYTRSAFWIKPIWREQIQAFIDSLRKKDKEKD